MYEYMYCLSQIMWNTSRISKRVYYQISLNSIYFQINIYTWQHTSIQIHGKWIGKQVTYINSSPSRQLKCKINSVGIGLFNSKVKMGGELLHY